MKRIFTLEYWMDEGWFVGRIKEVPGVFSQEESLEESLEKNIGEVYQMMMEEQSSLPFSHIELREKEIGVEF